MKKLGFIIILLSFIFIGCATDKDPYLWNQGRIPFMFVSPLPPAQTKNLVMAMCVWNTLTNGVIYFDNVTGRSLDDEDRVLRIIGLPNGFVEGAPLASSINGYKQYTNMQMFVDVSYKEISVGGFCHELGHIIGLDIHEFQRIDASLYLDFDTDYIKVLPAIIQYQFVPKKPIFYDIEKYPFDSSSIMMYPEETIAEFVRTVPENLQFEHPSIIDCQKVMNMYAEFFGW